MKKKQALHRTTRIVSILFSFFVLLTTTAAVAASVTIRWDPNAVNTEGYRLFIRESGQLYNYSQPAWEGATVTAILNNLKDNTKYYIVVRAYVGLQESVDSNEVEFISSTSSSSPQLDSDGDGIGNNADTDDDNDGIPDDWEVLYGLDPLVDDALQDLDADGTNNITEYVHGTDPSIIDNVVEDAFQVIDDGQTGSSSNGQWSTSGYVDPYGSQSLYSREVGATYSYTAMLSGPHDVALWWTQGPNRYPAVPVKIYDGATLLETVYVNQQEDGGQWNFLGIYNFTGQARVVVESKDSVRSTCADAVEFSKADNVVEDAFQVIDDGQTGSSSNGQWSTSGYVDPYGSQSLYSREVGATYSYTAMLSGPHDVALWWTQGPNRYPAVPVKIYDGATLLETVYVNQQEDGGQWNFLGIYNFTGQARVVVESKDSVRSTCADAIRYSPY